jgi:hypothetical protein
MRLRDRLTRRIEFGSGAKCLLLALLSAPFWFAWPPVISLLLAIWSIYVGARGKRSVAGLVGLTLAIIVALASLCMIPI